MLSDIGIGIEEDMEVLIEKGTGLPHEFTCKMSLHIDSISIYEGCSPFLKNNTCLGTYLFNNIKEGTFVFTLKVDLDYKMKILVDDVLLDTVQCNQRVEYEYTLSQVLDCPDVTAQEYKDSLAEIEGIVNPVLKKLKNKIEK